MTSPQHGALGIVGNLNVDILMGPSPLPVWEREVLAGSLEMRVAGTAGYLALAARALGMEPVILSALGTDHLSRFVLDELDAQGIKTSGIASLPGMDSPVTVAVVESDGKRALVTVLGAHEQIDLDFYRARNHLLADAGEIFLCGTYLLPNLGPQQALEIARESRKRGQQVIFDPSWDPRGWSEEIKNATFEVLKQVDLFLPNEEELCALTGTTDWHSAMARVGALGPEVVVKRGPRGSAAVVKGVVYEVEGVRVTARDTTGAGDVFDVGYLWARRQGWPPEKRLRFANTLAGLVVEEPRRTRYPSAEMVLDRMGCE